MRIVFLRPLLIKKRVFVYVENDLSRFGQTGTL